eukprot:20250_1
MTFTLFTVLCILSHNTHAAEYDGWIKETSQRLNKADEQIAIGYDGFYIYLIGGYSDTVETSRYEYDLFSNNVTTMSGIELYQKGYGQYYTQHDNILYMIFNTNLYFCDLTNKCDTLQTQNIGTGHNVMTTGCVTSNEDFIFVLGGGNGVSFNYAHLSILNLRTNNTWLSGPTMIYKRSLLSCVAHPTTGKLYAIGGKNDTTTTTATIEAITIADIFNENWSIVSSLLYPSTSARAVTHSDNILVIGAQLAMNEIQVINCLNNVVTSGGFLSYGVYNTAPIIVQNVLYAFGGNNGSSMVDTWQYFDLGALINTGPPTHNPTQATITDTPTLAPFTTNVPTSAMPTTTTPTTTMPTTTMPTTDTPTTHVFTFLPSYVPTTDTPTTTMPTTYVPTTDTPTTHVPTTDTPTTTMPTTYIPTHIPTTLEPTYPSITTKTYGVSIRIKFQYKLDVIITINVTDTIQETINIIVTESIETNCVLSNNDYEITTNNGQQNVTIVDVTVIVCNEISEANLRVAFKNDLKTDLQTNIQENNKLSIPNDLINIVISDIIVPKNTFISTTSENFNDTELSKEKSDNSFIYIFAIIGGVLVCIIVIICALCIYKFKTLHSEIESQELKKYVNRNAIKSDTSANSSNAEPGQTDMVKVQSVSIET